jgi:hypothetical protein
MSNKPTHWAELLDNGAGVGKPIEIWINRISDYKAQKQTQVNTIKNLDREIEDAEDVIFSLLKAEFTIEELTQARKRFYHEFQDNIPVQSYGDETDRATYILPGGKSIYISSTDIGFFRSLQALPAVTKIKMMNLTEEQLSENLQQIKKDRANQCINLLNKKWQWRETGDDLIIENELFFNEFKLDFTLKQIISKLKRGTLSDEKVKSIIHFFTRSFSEVKEVETH